ncbi:hypothetical protein B5C34_05300 [Pacificimonas flava]|uniref:Uncharacterized protein n=2 Tax=Pacificimonas TaxID=1960290 RepID=A0A219B587_9SPHN|nr:MULTISPECIES: hypothetical protein [Pacificimonas]MBZ6377364.1 hypothetical protein [Pacificimonas aurantium]OWV32928.1 hypothetical protein B5C34_05300 [Pacificimonas flava]
MNDLLPLFRRSPRFVRPVPVGTARRGPLLRSRLGLLPLTPRQRRRWRLLGDLAVGAGLVLGFALIAWMARDLAALGL